LRTPDSPENYNAFKDSQRQQNEKRQQFRVVAWLKDNDSSPVSDGQLAERVAGLTGSRPAPEDIVGANRDLFREADNKAWAERVGKEAPIMLASMGDPRIGPLSRESYDRLASLELATRNLVAASAFVPVGAEAGGRQSSSFAPNVAEEVANEPATNHQLPNSRGPATVHAESTSADTASTLPESLGANAKEGAEEGDTSAMAASAPTGGQAGSVGAGVDDDGVLPDFGPASPMPGVTAFEMPKIKLPEAPTAGVSLAQGIAGLGKNPGYLVVAAFRDLIGKQPYIPKDLALSVLDGVVTGKLTQEEALAKLTERTPADGQGGDSAASGLDSAGVASPLHGDPTADPEFDGRESHPSTKASGNLSSSSASVSAGSDANDGLRSGEAVEIVPESSDAASSKRGDPVASMPMPATEAAPAAEGSVEGTGQASTGVAPGVQASASTPVAEAAKTEPSAAVGQKRNGAALPWQMEEKQPVFLWEENLPESTGFVSKILGVRGMSRKEYWALRREIRHQHFIDASLALTVAKKLYYGEESLGWAQEMLQPPTLGGRVKEVFRGVPSGALNMGGFIWEGAGQLIHTTEPPAITEQKRAIVEALLSLKGKSEVEVEGVRHLIFQLDDPDLVRHLNDVLQNVVDGADMDEVRATLALFQKGMSGTLIEQGASLQDYSKTVLPVPLNLKGSWERSLGEGLGGAIPIIVGGAVAGPGAAWGAGTLGAVGSMSADARQHNADPEMQARVAWLGLPLALVTNAPIADKVIKLPWFKKFAGGWVGTHVLQHSVSGLQGAGQTLGTNFIAQQVYDPLRDLWKGVGSSFATGALVSVMDTGLKRAGTLAVSHAQRSYELHDMLDEMGERLKTFPPLTEDSKTARVVVETELKGTPAENVYFRADAFVDSLKNAGIDPWKFVLGINGATLADLKAAVNAKGYIRIPTATFAVDIMGTTAGSVLKPNLSFEPGGVTSADIGHHNSWWNKVGDPGEKLDEAGLDVQGGVAEGAKSLEVERGGALGNPGAPTPQSEVARDFSGKVRSFKIKPEERKVIEGKILNQTRGTSAEYTYIESSDIINYYNGANVNPKKALANLGVSTAEYDSVVRSGGRFRFSTSRVFSRLVGTKAGDVLLPKASFDSGLSTQTIGSKQNQDGWAIMQNFSKDFER
jgi:hypothetical protein